MLFRSIPANKGDFLFIADSGPGETNAKAVSYTHLEKAITLGVCIVPGYEFESMLAQYEQHNQDGVE